MRRHTRATRCIPQDVPLALPAQLMTVRVLQISARLRRPMWRIVGQGANAFLHSMARSLQATSETTREKMNTTHCDLYGATATLHQSQSLIRHVVLCVGFQPPAVTVHESTIGACSEKGG